MKTPTATEQIIALLKADGLDAVTAAQEAARIVAEVRTLKPGTSKVYTLGGLKLRLGNANIHQPKPCP